jgi:hypothetical protein
MLTCDTGQLPWAETGNPGLTQKTLYRHPVSGAQTILLRSTARPSAAITDRRPQVHPVDEEFLCLAGRFTLEGKPWLTPLTYVYYPANLVHGFHVDVPDGYEIYLRNSGTVTTERIDAPLQPGPYVITGAVSHGEVIIANCAELVDQASRSGQLAVITLRHDPQRGEGACIVCFPAGARLDLTLAEADHSAELFVINGGIKLADAARLPRHGHAVAAGPASMQIAAEQAAAVMLNVRGAGLTDAVIQQAGARYQCVNAHT